MLGDPREGAPPGKQRSEGAPYPHQAAPCPRLPVELVAVARKAGTLAGPLPRRPLRRFQRGDVKPGQGAASSLRPSDFFFERPNAEAFNVRYPPTVLRARKLDGRRTGVPGLGPYVRDHGRRSRRYGTASLSAQQRPKCQPTFPADVQPRRNVSPFTFCLPLRS